MDDSYPLKTVMTDVMPDVLFNQYLQNPLLLKHLPKPGSTGAQTAVHIVKFHLNTDWPGGETVQDIANAVAKGVTLDLTTAILFFDFEEEPDSHTYRDALYAAVFKCGRESLNTKGVPVAAFIFSETWQATVPQDEMKHVGSRSLTEVYPDQVKEVLCLMGCTVDGRLNMRSWEMIRRESGKLKQLKRGEIRPYNPALDAGLDQSAILEEFWRGYFSETREMMDGRG